MKVASNLVKDCLTYYSGKLAEIVGEREAKQQVLMLLQHYFGIDRTRMMLEPSLRISESELLSLHMAVKELMTHKPIQYVLGGTYFCDHWFSVDQNVLIPRPETEQLVHLIAHHTLSKQAMSILDIGTGSGCIAIMLKLLLDKPQVFGIDFSEKALIVAQRNASDLKAAVDLMLFDIFDDANQNSLPEVELIVSNPPYVLENEKQKMLPNVLNYEPANALFVADDDPLLFYTRIVALSDKLLKTGGMLWFEINEAFGDDLVSLLHSAGFKQTELMQDIHGRNRFISCIKS